jgi:hypothetical protein
VIKSRKVKIAGEFVTHWRNKEYIQSFSQKPRGKDHLEYTGVDEKVIKFMQEM